MPAAGDLRERVSLQEPTQHDDGYGNTVDGWAERGQRWAQYQMRAGSEAVNAARLEGRQPVTIAVRHDTLTRNVMPAWRIVDIRTGVAYAVLGSADMGRRREFISLTCEAVVS